MHTIDTNILVRAPAQYTGVIFNSYCNFGGVKLGFSSSGLHEVCCGDSDNGTEIDCSFAPVKTDFGVETKKQIRYVHVALKGDTKAQLEVSCDAGAAKTYDIPTPVTGQQYSRVTISSEHKGFYFYFKVKNVDGAALAVDHIFVEYYVLTGGRK